MKRIVLALKKIKVGTPAGSAHAFMLWVSTPKGSYYSSTAEDFVDFDLSFTRKGHDVTVYNRGIELFKADMSKPTLLGDELVVSSWVVDDVDLALQTISAFTVSGLHSIGGDIIPIADIPRFNRAILQCGKEKLWIGDLFKGVEHQSNRYSIANPGPKVHQCRNLAEAAARFNPSQELFGPPTKAITEAIELGLVPLFDFKEQKMCSLYVVSTARDESLEPEPRNTITEYQPDDIMSDHLRRAFKTREKSRAVLWDLIIEEAGIIFTA